MTTMFVYRGGLTAEQWDMLLKLVISEFPLKADRDAATPESVRKALMDREGDKRTIVRIEYAEEALRLARLRPDQAKHIQGKLAHVK